MADALDLSLLATTATDYARENKAPIFSKLIGQAWVVRQIPPSSPLMSL